MSDIKSKLKTLRDQLAHEGPRAKTYPSVPPDLARRLNEASELVANIYLMRSAPGAAAASAALDEVCQDALDEGTLALADWQTWLDQRNKARPRATTAVGERRVHERHETHVMVRLLRHGVRGEGEAATLDTETADREARDVSLGGMFVAAKPADLRSVGIGSVLHISVTNPKDKDGFHLRGAVTRRDTNGLALRFLLETPEEKATAQRLVAALTK